MGADGGECEPEGPETGIPRDSRMEEKPGDTGSGENEPPSPPPRRSLESRNQAAVSPGQGCGTERAPAMFSVNLPMIQRMGPERPRLSVGRVLTPWGRAIRAF